MSAYEYASIAALLWALAAVLMIFRPWDLD